MMAKAVSGFIASGENYIVPPNTTLLIMQVITWDRQNLAGTFTISATGYSETVQADSSGRATKLVPSGTTYTISLTHQGSYLNDGDQLVTANAEEIAWVTFTLSIPSEHQTAEITVPAAGGTVTVQGMTSDAIVWVSPAPESFDIYAKASCRCTAQAANSLTFEVEEEAEDDMTVNVAWVHTVT